MPRIVFTGAPSSGKSSTAQAIRSLRPSWKIHEEIATSIIRTCGRPKSEEAFSRQILSEMLKLEANQRSKSIEIYDRAIPDSLTYLAILGAPNAIDIDCTGRYDLVFYFESLAFVKSETRNDFDFNKAQTLSRALPDAYRKLGIPVQSVERAAILDRTKFIVLEIEKRFCNRGENNAVG